MPLLELSGLKKSYRSPDGEVQAVLDVASFQLEAREQVAIAGASGSGKTTFLNLIAGLLRPDAGTVRFDGREISALSEAGRDRFRARSLGYVFQTFNLLAGYTALENVLLGMLFGPGRDHDQARELLVRLGLEGRLNYLPGQLSVGQQQRVALARALANHPRLVLADEPTGNLDAHHGAEALRLIRELCRERETALLLVSHDRDVLADFEKVVRFSELNRVRAPVAGAAAGGEPSG